MGGGHSEGWGGAVAPRWGPRLRGPAEPGHGEGCPGEDGQVPEDDDAGDDVGRQALQHEHPGAGEVADGDGPLERPGHGPADGTDADRDELPAEEEVGREPDETGLDVGLDEVVVGLLGDVGLVLRHLDADAGDRVVVGQGQRLRPVAEPPLERVRGRGLAHRTVLRDRVEAGTEARHEGQGEQAAGDEPEEEPPASLEDRDEDEPEDRCEQCPAGEGEQQEDAGQPEEDPEHHAQAPAHVGVDRHPEDDHEGEVSREGRRLGEGAGDPDEGALDVGVRVAGEEAERGVDDRDHEATEGDGEGLPERACVVDELLHHEEHHRHRHDARQADEAHLDRLGAEEAEQPRHDERHPGDAEA